MLKARLIDPAIADFVRAPGGRFAQAVSPVATKLIYCYQVPLGAWEGDPSIGHRFGELAREKDSASTRSRLKDFARQAASWLIESGELDRLEVTVEPFAPGRLAFEVDAYEPGKSTPTTVGPFFVPIAV